MKQLWAEPIKSTIKDGIYFISFATEYWIDIFTKNEYEDIVVESLSYCQKAKGQLDVELLV